MAEPSRHSRWNAVELRGGAAGGSDRPGGSKERELEKLKDAEANKQLDAGGGGGAAFRDACPKDFVVNRLHVRSGSWVDGANAFCVGLRDVPPPSPPAPRERLERERPELKDPRGLHQEHRR